VLKLSYMVPVLLVLVSLLMPSFAGAATGFAFLQNGVDARATLFGEAMVSHVDDASACYWNPAGLSKIDNAQVVVSHVASFADLRHEFASAVQPLFDGDLVAGLYFNGLWTDDLDGYDRFARPTGRFGYSTYTAGLALGKMIGSNLSAGAGVKLLNESIDEYSASGWSADLGLQWALGDSPLSFGFSALNIGPGLSFEIGSESGDSFDLPMALQGGVSFHQSLSTAGDILISLEGRKLKDRDAAMLGGIEYTYRNTLSMGVGYQGGADTRDVSFGLGLNHGRFGFNWAFVPIKEDLGDENRFSMRLEL